MFNLFKKSKKVNKCIVCRCIVCRVIFESFKINVFESSNRGLCKKCYNIRSTPFDSFIAGHLSMNNSLLFKSVKYYINRIIFEGRWDMTSIRSINEYIILRDKVIESIEKVDNEIEDRRAKNEQIRLKKERKVIEKCLV